MKTREEYDSIIDKIKTNLGDDNFSKISGEIAELSTDYDTVIQGEKDFKEKLDNLNAEKIQLLETNNKLFRQVTNTSKLDVDPVVKEEEEKNQKIEINDFINEEGGME